MPCLNAAFAEECVQRLARLSPDARPVWGNMTVPQLLGHLNMVVRHTMGERPAQVPYKGNFKSRHIYRHLILGGLLAIPRNIRMPRPPELKSAPMPECMLEQLRETLNEYLLHCQEGKLQPQLHPFFGQLTAREWTKFHAAHFKHHLTQFGV